MGKNKKEDNYGSAIKFDPDFSGPLHKRSCTDVLCLLLFVAFLAAWGVTAYFAFAYGDPARLLNPTDSQGRRCGVDDGVKDKKYLFFFDLMKCADPAVVVNGCNTPQICVSRCPSEAFYLETYNLPGFDLASLRNKILCLPEVDVNTITSVAVARTLVQQEKCAAYYFLSASLYGRCIPLKREAGDVAMAGISELSFLVDAILRRFTDDRRTIEVPSQHEVLASYRALITRHDISQQIVQDLSSSWPWIVGLLAIAMVVCLLFIVLMRWFAGIMVWISLIGVHVSLAYSIYACWYQWDYLKRNPPAASSPGLNLKEQTDALLAMKGTWLAFMIISCILLAVVFILTIFLRSRIRVAIALIGEASKAVGSVTSTLIFPLVPWVLQCGVIAWTVTLIFFLASSGKEVFKVTGVNQTVCSCQGVSYQDGDVCSMDVFADCATSCLAGHCRFWGFQSESYVGWLQAVNGVGFFWALFFISALGEMILAGTFATWYWTYDKSKVPFFAVTQATGRTFRYHLGTLAFGALIIAICRMIRIVLEFISNQLNKYDNCCVKVLSCCCRCFFWCLESFIKFVNRNAYIMCAVHGKNFCASAKDAFELLMRNVVRVVVLDKVTDFLLLLGKLLITSGVCSLAFFLFSRQISVPELDVPTLNYSLMPVFIVAFGTFFIATLFFNVYAMAVDTLFLCFLEDSERNDGSVDKPYFMSKDLRKLLGKKNKTT